MVLKNTIIEFLEDELPSWSNTYGVQLYLNTDSSLLLFAGYPGVEQNTDTTLELMREFKSLDHFLSVMGLTSLEQLQQLNPENLLNWYGKGQLYMICSLEGHTDRQLRFKKYPELVRVIDTRSQQHNVTLPLSKPQDFIDYTIKYYQVRHN